MKLAQILAATFGVVILGAAIAVLPGLVYWLSFS